MKIDGFVAKKRFDDKDEMNANVVNDMIRSHKDHSIKKNNIRWDDDYEEREREKKRIDNTILLNWK